MSLRSYNRLEVIPSRKSNVEFSFVVHTVKMNLQLVS